MRKFCTSFILAASVCGLCIGTTHAESDPRTKVKRVETPVPVKLEPTPAGFSNTVIFRNDPKVLNSQQPDIGSLAAEFRSGDQSSDWVDEGGNPLTLTQTGDEIVIRRDRGPTSRVVLTDMSGLNAPAIGTSAVTITD